MLNDFVWYISFSTKTYYAKCNVSLTQPNSQKQLKALKVTLHHEGLQSFLLFELN